MNWKCVSIDRSTDVYFGYKNTGLFSSAFPLLSFETKPTITEKNILQHRFVHRYTNVYYTYIMQSVQYFSCTTILLLYIDVCDLTTLFRCTMNRYHDVLTKTIIGYSKRCSRCVYILNSFQLRSDGIDSL